MNPNEQQLDRQTRHDVYLRRYAGGLIKRLQGAASEPLARLLRYIRATDPASFISVVRLEPFLTQLAVENQRLFEVIRRSLTSELEALTKHEVDMQSAWLKKLVVEGTPVTPLNTASVWRSLLAKPFAGQLLGEWLGGLETSQYNHLKQAIREGFLQGESTPKIMARIRGTRANRNQDGVLALTHRQLETVTRTAVTHTATVTREAAVQANKGLFRAALYSAILDARTTPICASLDGKTFPVDKGPRPPQHPNCRSSVVFLLKGQPNPEIPTYSQWLKRQPKEVVTDILGKTKGEAFLKGELSLDRFVDARGRELTLAELGLRDAS